MKHYSHLNDIYISDRLRQRLELVSSVPVTTVTAPIGYGKTTAVRWWKKHFIKALPNAVIVEQIITGSGTTDFWNSLCRLLRRFPVLSEQIEALGFPKDREDVFLLSELLHSALEQVEYPVFYILDDIHFITDGWFLSLISLLAQHLPEQLHFILLSRSRIFSETDRFKLGSVILQITSDDLSLNEDEISSYAHCCALPLESGQVNFRQ